MYKIFPSYHYYEHPTDPNYLIYTLRKKEMAVFFEEGLNERGIFFESDEDKPNNVTLYHYAVKQSDRDKSMEMFMLTWAKFRKPFFYGTPVRFILLLLLGTLITLAIIGFIKN